MLTTLTLGTFLFLSYGIFISQVFSSEYSESEQKDPSIIFDASVKHAKSEVKTESLKSVLSENLIFSAKMHPWGQFHPGAWRLTKMCVETYEKNKEADRITCTDVYTTLQSLENDEVTCVVESFVNLAGKKVKMDPKTRIQGFHGLEKSEFKSYQVQKSESLCVGGVPVTCEVVCFSHTDEKVKKNVRIWVNRSLFPYIFKKEVRIQNMQTGEMEELTRLEVTKLNCQIALFGKIFKGFQTKIDTTFSSRTVNSVLVSSGEIPGGVVSRVSREMDADGNLLQVSSGELIDFGLHEEDFQNDLQCKNSVRFARGSIFRPSVSSRTAAEAPKTLQFTLNLTNKKSGESKISGVYQESGDFIRFRDRLLQRNRNRELVKQNVSEEEAEQAENQAKESSETNFEEKTEGVFRFDSRPERYKNLDRSEETYLEQVPPFATKDMEENDSQKERKSPLYQIRKRDIRKKKQETGKIVAFLDSLERELIYKYNTSGKEASENAELSVEKPSSGSVRRTSWRNHWRAAIMGE